MFPALQHSSAALLAAALAAEFWRVAAGLNVALEGSTACIDAPIATGLWTSEYLGNQRRLCWCCVCLQFWSNGISACAICDGASSLFKDREVAVVGGGDSAAEEAVYLTKYASRVHLLVRGPQMRASKAMADRASSHPRVQVHYNTAVEDGYGSSVLEVSAGRQSSRHNVSVVRL